MKGALNQNSIPKKHGDYLSSLLSVVKEDERIIGVAAIGSLAFGDIDQYSDLDLLIVCEKEHHEDMIVQSRSFAERAGSLLSCYRGHHVGEPRLLICLYGEPLLHVDLTFFHLDDFAHDRVQEPLILFERDKRLSDAVAGIEVDFPELDRQELEDKFWVWIFNATNKLARGDLFHALVYLSSIRRTALMPLIQHNAGVIPRGYRTLRDELPGEFERLKTTHARNVERKEIARALRAMVDHYRVVRQHPKNATVNHNEAAETAVMEFLSSLE